MKRLTFPRNVQHSLHSGVCEAACGYVLRELYQHCDERIHIFVTRSAREASRTLVDFRLLSRLDPKNTFKTLRFPLIDEEQNSRSVEDYLDCVTALEALQRKSKDNARLCLFTTLDALTQSLPRPDALSKQTLILHAGQETAPATLAEKLVEMGYAHEMVCEQPGEFAQRGGILDIYPVNATQPIRLDFFGDELESLRAFDPQNQLTTSQINEAHIAPAVNLAPEEDSSTHRLTDYLPEERIQWVLLEPEMLEQEHSQCFQVPEKITARHFHLGVIWESRPTDSWLGICELDTERSIFTTAVRDWQSESLLHHREFPFGQDLGLERLESERQARADFLQTLDQWAREGFTLHFMLGNEAECERLKRILEEESFKRLLKARFLTGDLREGFILHSDDSPKKRGEIWVTRTEIFGTRSRAPLVTSERERVHHSQVDNLLDFAELADGDALVHLQHGVCLYRGINRIRIGDQDREMLTLEFDSGVEIHLPLHESHLLSRYVGLNKARPKLGKPGSNHWEKTRAAAEKATLDYAAEMLSIQAKRNSEPGHAFAPDNPWQEEFEATFPYKETPDQLTSIDDAKRDMEEARAMDRLLCGDVGFGKTEVALRAAFKAVMDGRQVALLVPTTVLAQQHFQTFRERMAPYPISVEMLSRFRTPSQRTRILSQLKSGGIDILIGTHAILGKQVRFDQLGLVIVDEEHRFGVRHKEQLKRMRANVDILSMSATPIPRTLYLALMGARSLSVIETAPRDRLPIETVVKNYSEELVTGAITREVERGGQIFYLHNRVQTIDLVAKRLQQLLPKLRIGIGHGQMDEKSLEQEMAAFVEGRYDVFVCTTIIESGLDIPNCNTIIIEGADRFGLSQLYQLRGRVGRFKRQAYCYLLLHRHSALVDQARKRLTSLRQHNQLGAGFRIAMRDLELRGAGHLLGDKQSGFIAGVGFDLYCQLLRQSIARLNGDPIAARIRAQVQLDFVKLGESLGRLDSNAQTDFSVLKAEDAIHCPTIEANIPTSYIPEAQLRIELYRKLATTETTDEVNQLEAATADRFGKIPDSVQALILSTQIRVLAEEKGFSRVRSDAQRLICHFANKSRGEYFKIGTRFPRLTAQKPLYRLREIISFLQRQPNHT